MTPPPAGPEGDGARVDQRELKWRLKAHLAHSGLTENLSTVVKKVGCFLSRHPKSYITTIQIQAKCNHCIQKIQAKIVARVKN